MTKRVASTSSTGIGSEDGRTVDHCTRAAMRLLVDHGRDKAQESLVLWVTRPTREEGAGVEVGHLIARRRVRFMPDEHALRVGVEAQKPAISVRAAVNLSRRDGHRIFPSCIRKGG